MLKPVLLANAASCAIFGALFVLYSNEVSAFVGSPPALLLKVVGAGLIVNAALMIATAARSNPPRRDILLFVLGDASWVAITALLLVSGLWVTTASGIAWSLAVAAFVGLCGFLQWKWAPASVLLGS